MPLKIAMIGAGSVGFTRRLMTDLLTVPEFGDYALCADGYLGAQFEHGGAIVRARHQGEWIGRRGLRLRWIGGKR